MITPLKALFEFIIVALVISGGLAYLVIETEPEYNCIAGRLYVKKPNYYLATDKSCVIIDKE